MPERIVIVKIEKFLEEMKAISLSMPTSLREKLSRGERAVLSAGKALDAFQNLADEGDKLDAEIKKRKPLLEKSPFFESAYQKYVQWTGLRR